MKSFLSFFISFLSVCILYTSLPCEAKRELKITLQMEVPQEGGGQRFNGASCTVSFLESTQAYKWNQVAVVPNSKSFTSQESSAEIPNICFNYPEKFFTKNQRIFILNEQYRL